MYQQGFRMKRYLTGIDWVINSIDHIGKARTGIGNVSQVVIELNGLLDSAIMQEKLRGFLEKFPVINGLPSRGLNLCPYWKIFPGKNMLPVRIHVTRLKDNADPFPVLEAQVNAPFAHKREHLVFNLVSAGKRSFLGMTFDHRILDARGAVAFLDLFQRYCQKEPLPEIVLESPSYLNNWREKFKAGQQVNRVFLNLIRRKTPRTLPAPLPSRVCKFRVISFDQAQTTRFIDTAYASAGYLMLMPYILARNVQIMHRVFEARKVCGSTYLVPVSIDSRPQDVEIGELFFNHVSFFLFEIGADIVDDLPLLLARIKEQMYEQVKTGLSEALKNACLLLRIAPLPLVNVFMQRMSKKQFASFSFSLVGSAYCANKFMELEPRNIFHLPRVPNPPGAGIFFNQHNGRINATFSYFEGLFTDNEVEQITSGLKAMANGS
jgi:hypothetical protein